MIFDFLKRLFGLVDDGSRKRHADDGNNDCSSGNASSAKKHCSSRLGREIYADENNEEDRSLRGKFVNSGVRTKEQLNKNTLNFSKRKLARKNSQTPRGYRNSTSQMNGTGTIGNSLPQDSPRDRSSSSNVYPFSTLTRSNQLRQKKEYGDLLKIFMPHEKIQVIRRETQEDEQSKSQRVIEMIDLAHSKIMINSITVDESLREIKPKDPPSTPKSLVSQKSMTPREKGREDVPSTPQSSISQKFVTPRERKKEDSATLPQFSTPLSMTPREMRKLPDDQLSILEKIDHLGASINRSRRQSSEVTPVQNKIPLNVSVRQTTPNVLKSQPSTSSLTRSPIEIIETNTLRDSLAAKAVIKHDYVPRISDRYNERIELKKKEVEELERATSLLAKHNRLARETALEERFAQSMRLSKTVLDETEESKEEALPKLTESMLREIKHALVPNPPNEVLVESFGLRITRKDINTLSGLNWLNDEVINFYMNLLIVRGTSNDKKYPKVHAMNTFFYPKLLSGGHASLKRWTRKIDVFAQDIVVVPIHLGIHWCMSIIDFRDKTIRYFDSMGSSNPQCLVSLRKYLEDESMDKKKQPYDTRDWKLISMKDIPQQMNGSDCGVFSCMFAEFVTGNKKITFTQKDMPYFRHKMVYEILKAKLL